VITLATANSGAKRGIYALSNPNPSVRFPTYCCNKNNFVLRFSSVPSIFPRLPVGRSGSGEALHRVRRSDIDWEPEEPLTGFPTFLDVKFLRDLAVQHWLWAAGYDLFFHPHSIAESDAPAGDGRDALTGHDNPHEIQRIGGRDRDAFASSW
jgi:hypothetical protein